MGEITPYNRIENFLAKGSGADVAPYNRLERILAGEDLEPTNRLEYFAKEAAGGGGGNPNRVQTITGTLADPWGDLDYQELFDALSNNNASCRLVADLTALGMPNIETLLYANENEDAPSAYSSGAVIGSSEIYECYQAIWHYVDGDLVRFGAVLSGVYQNLLSYASAIPTTITIIWHPLPDQS